MTKPTMQNLFVCIDTVLGWGYGYCLLVSATIHSTRMLLDDSEEPLPVAEMISIRNTRHVRMWWSMNSPREPMDLLFCSHRTGGEDGTPPPSAGNFGPRDNRGQTPNLSVHGNELDSDGHLPELSAAAAKRITRLSPKITGSGMRKTGQRVRSGLEEVNELEPDSNRSSATKVVPALDSGFTPSPSKQSSAPPTDLGICALRSGRQIRRKTNLKEVFQLYTRTAVNRRGKRDLAAMAEADEPNGPVYAAEPPRKVTCDVPIIDSSIEGEPDRLHGEVNPSRQPTATPSPPDSPPPLDPNPTHDLASAASEDIS